MAVKLHQSTRTDVAGHNSRAAGGNHFAREHSGGGLAVGAGDADHDRLVGAVAFQALEFSRKEFDFAHDLGALFARGCDKRSRLGKFRRQARTQHQQINAVGNERHVEVRADEPRFGSVRLKKLEPRRVRCAVNDRGLPTAGMQKASRCGSRRAASEHQRLASVFQANMRHSFLSLVQTRRCLCRPTARPLVFNRLIDQRILRVDRPMSTSTNVMIQKRTTTCVSFQPLSSK